MGWERTSEEKVHILVNCVCGDCVEAVIEYVEGEVLARQADVAWSGSGFGQLSSLRRGTQWSSGAVLALDAEWYCRNENAFSP